MSKTESDSGVVIFMDDAFVIAWCCWMHVSGGGCLCGDPDGWFLCD